MAFMKLWKIVIKLPEQFSIIMPESQWCFGVCLKLTKINLQCSGEPQFKIDLACRPVCFHTQDCYLYSVQDGLNLKKKSNKSTYMLKT